MKKVLITGASGVLGRAMVAACAEAGLPVIQAVRDAGRARPGIEHVLFDYTRPETLAPAMEGIGGLFLVAPPLDPEAPAKLAPAVACAREAGAGQIVFISAMGVNHNEQAPLRKVEHMVMESGIPYAILRPNFFMENFSEGFLAAGIKAQGRILLAAGEGKTSFIAVRDIAAVAVECFRKPLAGVELDLTGREALDHAEVARIISEVSGRAVAYHPLTEEQMLAGARAAGMPETAVAYMAALYQAVRAGLAAADTGVVEKVTGRPPVTFREFARSAAAAWR